MKNSKYREYNSDRISRGRRVLNNIVGKNKFIFNKDDKIKINSKKIDEIPIDITNDTQINIYQLCLFINKNIFSVSSEEDDDNICREDELYEYNILVYIFLLMGFQFKFINDISEFRLSDRINNFNLDKLKKFFVDNFGKNGYDYCLFNGGGGTQYTCCKKIGDKIYFIDSMSDKDTVYDNNNELADTIITNNTEYTIFKYTGKNEFYIYYHLLQETEYYDNFKLQILRQAKKNLGLNPDDYVYVGTKNHTDILNEVDNLTINNKTLIKYFKESNIPKLLKYMSDAGSKPISVSGSKPISVSGSKPISVSGSKPISVSGSKPISVSGSKPILVSSSKNVEEFMKTSKYRDRQLLDLSCGRRALNNIVGKQKFIFNTHDRSEITINSKKIDGAPIDLNNDTAINMHQLCLLINKNIFSISSDEDLRDICRADELYEYYILVYVFLLMGFQFKFTTDIYSHRLSTKIDNFNLDKLKKFFVDNFGKDGYDYCLFNLGAAHYTCCKKNGDKIYYIDSMSDKDTVYDNNSDLANNIITKNTEYTIFKYTGKNEFYIYYHLLQETGYYENFKLQILRQAKTDLGYNIDDPVNYTILNKVHELTMNDETLMKYFKESDIPKLLEHQKIIMSMDGVRVPISRLPYKKPPSVPPSVLPSVPPSATPSPAPPASATPLSSTLPVIPIEIIDEYSFRGKNKYINRGDLNKIVCIEIKKNTESVWTEMYYYSNKYQLGFWHLCVIDSDGYILESDNKISSIVHITLQNYINQIYDILPEIFDDHRTKPIISSVGKLIDTSNKKIIIPINNVVLSEYSLNTRSNKLIKKYVKILEINGYNNDQIVVKISGNIYSIELVKKTDKSDKIILIYIKYNLRLGLKFFDEIIYDVSTTFDYLTHTETTSLFTKHNKYAPIMVVKNNNKITGLGLNNALVNPNKMEFNTFLNNDSECTLHERNYYLLFYNYFGSNTEPLYYIGTRQDGVFPFNEIDKMNVEITECQIGGIHNTTKTDEDKKILKLLLIKSLLIRNMDILDSLKYQLLHILHKSNLLKDNIKVIEPTKYRDETIIEDFLIDYLHNYNNGGVFVPKFSDSNTFMNKYYKLYDYVVSIYYSYKKSSIKNNTLLYIFNRYILCNFFNNINQIKIELNIYKKNVSNIYKLEILEILEKILNEPQIYYNIHSLLIMNESLSSKKEIIVILSEIENIKINNECYNKFMNIYYYLYYKNIPLYFNPINNNEKHYLDFIIKDNKDKSVLFKLHNINKFFINIDLTNINNYNISLINYIKSLPDVQSKLDYLNNYFVKNLYISLSGSSDINSNILNTKRTDIAKCHPDRSGSLANINTEIYSQLDNIRTEIIKELLELNIKKFDDITLATTIAPSLKTAPAPSFTSELAPATEIKKIVIDDYEFIGKNKGYKELRKIVCLKINKKGETKIEEVYYYTSLSELNFWRVLAMNGDAYHKGTDYVLGTLVHIELQKYIDEIFNELPDMTQEDLEIPNNIKYQDVHSKIILTSEINHKTDYEFKYENRLRNLEIPLPDCGNFNYSIPIQVKKLIDEKFKSKYIAKLEKKFIMKYNKIIPVLDFISTYGIIKICGKIYSIELHNKDNSNDILIFTYIYYNLRAGYQTPYGEFYDIQKVSDDFEMLEGEKIPLFTKHKKLAPISLIEQKSKITDLGLNSRIVPMGSYICKILDYSTQVNEYEKLKYLLFDNYSRQKYCYIGTRFDNIYPFDIIEENKILQDELNDCDIGGVHYTTNNETEIQNIINMRSKSYYASSYNSIIIDNPDIFSKIFLSNKYNLVNDDIFINKYYRLIDFIYCCLHNYNYNLSIKKIMTANNLRFTLNLLIFQNYILCNYFTKKDDILRDIDERKKDVNNKYLLNLISILELLYKNQVLLNNFLNTILYFYNNKEPPEKITYEILLSYINQYNTITSKDELKLYFSFIPITIDNTNIIITGYLNNIYDKVYIDLLNTKPKYNFNINVNDINELNKKYITEQIPPFNYFVNSLYISLFNNDNHTEIIKLINRYLDKYPSDHPVCLLITNIKKVLELKQEKEIIVVKNKYLKYKNKYLALKSKITN